MHHDHLAPPREVFMLSALSLDLYPSDNTVEVAEPPALANKAHPGWPAGCEHSYLTCLMTPSVCFALPSRSKILLCWINTFVSLNLSCAWVSGVFRVQDE